MSWPQFKVSDTYPTHPHSLTDSFPPLAPLYTVQLSSGASFFNHYIHSSSAGVGVCTFFNHYIHSSGAGVCVCTFFNHYIHSSGAGVLSSVFFSFFEHYNQSSDAGPVPVLAPCGHHDFLLHMTQAFIFSSHSNITLYSECGAGTGLVDLTTLPPNHWLHEHGE